MELRQIVASSPGKLILFGEHSVVYGKTAIAVSVDKRTQLQLDLCHDGYISVQFNDVQLNKQWTVASIESLQLQGVGDPLQPSSLLEEHLDKIHKFLEIVPSTELMPCNLAAVIFIFLLKNIINLKKFPGGFKACVKTELVVAAGLGSSASFAVCLVTVLLTLSGAIKHSIQGSGEHAVVSLQKEDHDLINRWAYIAEEVCHGKPSGIDNTICTLGGAVSFKRGKFQAFKIGPGLQILLVDTKVPRNTKLMVARVKERHSRHTGLVNHILDAMDAVAMETETLLQKTDADLESGDALYNLLGEMIDINQGLLYSLGISHPKLDEIIAVANAHGLHAKLTGAGGGGFAFILLRGNDTDKLEATTQDLASRGYECHHVKIGGAGAQLAIVT